MSPGRVHHGGAAVSSSRFRGISGINRAILAFASKADGNLAIQKYRTFSDSIQFQSGPNTGNEFQGNVTVFHCRTGVTPAKILFKSHYHSLKIPWQGLPHLVPQMSIGNIQSIRLDGEGLASVGELIRSKFFSFDWFSKPSSLFLEK